MQQTRYIVKRFTYCFILSSIEMKVTTKPRENNHFLALSCLLALCLQVKNLKALLEVEVSRA
jgi:hypothetical protein